MLVRPRALSAAYSSASASRTAPGLGQRHEVLGAVDEFAVQPPVRIASDAAARYLRRRFVDAPAGERRAVQHIFVPAADDDDRLPRRRAVEIVTVGEAVLGELPLVPVAVRDDQLPGGRLQREGGDRVDHFRHRSRARQVDAGPAPDPVVVVVGEPRDHGASVQLHDARAGSGQPANLLRSPHRQHPAAAHRQRLHHPRRPEREHVSVHEYEIRRLPRGRRPAGRKPQPRDAQRRQHGDGP